MMWVVELCSVMNVSCLVTDYEGLANESIVSEVINSKFLFKHLIFVIK